MSLQQDTDALEKRIAEQRAAGLPVDTADKVEAAGLMLQAAGTIVMCIFGLIVLGVLVYACAG